MTSWRNYFWSGCENVFVIIIIITRSRVGTRSFFHNKTWKIRDWCLLFICRVRFPAGHHIYRAVNACATLILPLKSLGSVLEIFYSILSKTLLVNADYMKASETWQPCLFLMFWTEKTNNDVKFYSIPILFPLRTGTCKRTTGQLCASKDVDHF